MPDKCSNCPREFGDGDLYVQLQLIEHRSDPAPVGFLDPESEKKLCLVCYDDMWRLCGEQKTADAEFYSTDRNGEMYRHQARIPASK